MKRREVIKNLIIGSAAAFTLPLLTKEIVAQDAVYSMDDLMYWKLEPTGVCARVRDGKIGIQLRFCFYLTDKSAFYKSRLVEEKKVTQIGVKYSEIEKKEVPDYKYENTGNMINTPFHNHIVDIVPVPVQGLPLFNLVYPPPAELEVVVSIPTVIVAILC